MNGAAHVTWTAVPIIHDNKLTSGGLQVKAKKKHQLKLGKKLRWMSN